MDLLELSKETIALVCNFEKDSRTGLDYVQTDWITYFNVMNQQFDSMFSVLDLLERERFRDCFILIRSIFESFFCLLLMLKGELYKETREIKIIPKKGNKPEEARDNTLDLWTKKWLSGDPNFKKVIFIQKGMSSDTILITIKDKGLFYKNDDAKKGPLITKYYFAFEDYNPETRFVAHLPSIHQGIVYKEQTVKEIRKQKRLYHQYVNVQYIVKNLVLNELLSEEQDDRFWVHYNFLSTFVHTTKQGNWRLYQISYPGYLPPEKLKEGYKELIQIYICRLQHLFIETMVDYFMKINPKANFTNYKKQSKKLKDVTYDFWFIYNDPTNFDIKRSENLKKTLKMIGRDVETEGILYYRNPVKRLLELRGSSTFGPREIYY